MVLGADDKVGTPSNRRFCNGMLYIVCFGTNNEVLKSGKRIDSPSPFCYSA